MCLANSESHLPFSSQFPTWLRNPQELNVALLRTNFLASFLPFFIQHACPRAPLAISSLLWHRYQPRKIGKKSPGRSTEKYRDRMNISLVDWMIQKICTSASKGQLNIEHSVSQNSHAQLNNVGKAAETWPWSKHSLFRTFRTQQAGHNNGHSKQPTIRCFERPFKSLIVQITSLDFGFTTATSTTDFLHAHQFHFNILLVALVISSAPHESTAPVGANF